MSLPLARARPRSRTVAALTIVLILPIFIALAVSASTPRPARAPLAAPGSASDSAGSPPAPAQAAVIQPEPEPPPPPQPSVPFLEDHRVVSYYGHPLASSMGIVGEYPPDELIRRLRAQVDIYQALSPDRTVVPAIHLIYAVAQAGAGGDGLHLGRMSDELVQKWIQITRDNGLLLFLDIQFGRSTVDRELPRVLPYLTEPHVHLALDPEFAWPADKVPVSSIGYLTGAQVNRAQELMQAFLVEHGIASKILIVHQFRRDMLRQKEQIQPFERVELVIDADGFGPPATKLDSWNSVIVADGVQRAGIKLFYKHDAESGGLMSEADVMALEPAPVVIIYQ